MKSSAGPKGGEYNGYKEGSSKKEGSGKEDSEEKITRL